MRRAIRRYSRDFIAIAVLAALALITTVVILTQQRAPFPSWLPVIGEDTFELRAEFTSAQAVIPGQGQTVNLAGVKVGDVSGVELEDGTAVVTMEVERDYQDLIHPDASMLLRPRTGLQDMTIQLDGGTATEAVEDGETIPLANTKPNVNVDQILAGLDADTRSYLKLLLNGASQAFEGDGQSRELAATFKRFAPTARDLAKINGALAKRRKNLARVIHNLGLVLDEVGRGDQQLAEFVDSSNAVMAQFADQEGSLRAALREAPGALGETRSALAASNRLNDELEPALRELIPAARALGPALEATQPFFAETTGPIRDQIRPFTRQTRDSVEVVTRTAPDLKGAIEQLETALDNLNLLTNQLAYNPPGKLDEGYLFWLAWLNHNTNGLFTIQDAHGPVRRGLVLFSCATARFAQGVTASRPLLNTLRQVTRVPEVSEICPLTPGG
jgi:phospholipid/cholesterol/gamma-HCH transport system substrate-binding protein